VENFGQANISYDEFSNPNQNPAKHAAVEVCRGAALLSCDLPELSLTTMDASIHFSAVCLAACSTKTRMSLDHDFSAAGSVPAKARNEFLHGSVKAMIIDRNKHLLLSRRRTL
jgi:hypothetical protein